MAPGQFLRHYSPDIVSYLFTGETQKDISKAIILDFGQILSRFRPQAKYYYDMSEEGDFLQAIHRVYDALRWAETNTDAEYVLITDLIHFKGSFSAENNQGLEHLDALFDRLFRATSGQSA